MAVTHGVELSRVLREFGPHIGDDSGRRAGGLIGLVIGAITVVLAFTTTGGGVGSSPLLLAIFSALTILAAGMVTPITSTYETLIYADLRIRKENFASVLAQASNQQ